MENSNKEATSCKTVTVHTSALPPMVLLCHHDLIFFLTKNSKEKQLILSSKFHRIATTRKYFQKYSPTLCPTELAARRGLAPSSAPGLRYAHTSAVLGQLSPLLENRNVSLRVFCVSRVSNLPRLVQDFPDWGTESAASPECPQVPGKPGQLVALSLHLLQS